MCISGFVQLCCPCLNDSSESTEKNSGATENTMLLDVRTPPRTVTMTYEDPSINIYTVVQFAPSEQRKTPREELQDQLRKEVKYPVRRLHDESMFLFVARHRAQLQRISRLREQILTLSSNSQYADSATSAF